MRLHLGAGNKYWPGWVNVDLFGDQDVTSNILDLPFDDDSVDEIQAIHVFEHIDRMKVVDALKEWRRVLKNGGKLVLEMPSLDKVIGFFKQDCNDFRMTLLALYGDPREENEYMLHKWCWSADELTKQLNASGFSVKITQPLFHIPKRDLRCVATKEHSHE